MQTEDWWFSLLLFCEIKKTFAVAGKHLRKNLTIFLIFLPTVRNRAAQRKYKHMKQQGSKDTDELDNEDDNEDNFAEIGQLIYI